MSSSKYRFIDEALAERKRDHRFRSLTGYEPDGAVSLNIDDHGLCNFSGNDYLGLSKHPAVVQRAEKYAEDYGAGSAASRLISGTYSIHSRLEDKLATTFRREAAMVFNSGFQANSTIISTIADRHTLILADKLSHNSLLQGSLSSRAVFRRFDHNNISDLERHLEQAAGEEHSRILVITESLFSMDGDRSDLETIADLTDRYDAWLFVDDAHAMGVWGESGRGLTYGINDIDMVLGTCGKAFGSFGAFLLCSEKMKDYLVNFCAGFIYTTALPPAVIGSIEAALELIPTMNSERKRLHRHIDYVRGQIHEIGFETGDSDTQIIPIVVGEDKKALELADYLYTKGFLATAIRPPTVPEGSARIRITLSSAHTKNQIDQFLKALGEWKNG